jgi:lipid II:glycine glycyltransferase (peptidoglycan interpeptide bridge formation enzyme)
VELVRLDGSEELLQSGFWGSFKASHGWTPLAFEVHAGSAAFGLLVLLRRLGRLFHIAYVPFGPTYDPREGRGGLLRSLAAALRPHLPCTTLFLRFDLPWEKTGESPGADAGSPRKTADDIQPAATVIVDLTPSEDQILSAMKEKTRYNVRLAAKKGVAVREGTDADMDAWYELYRETGRRDRIAIHSKAYYAALFSCARRYEGRAPVVKLLLAEGGGRLLAGNIVLFWRDSSVYLTGASSGEMRNLMPTYALQWEAMKMAKAAGCASYDLYGVPPSPDPACPMSGLYQFKTGFSNRIVSRWGTWDVSFLGFPYALYMAAEKARMFFFRRLRKRARGSP